jgi:double-stranded uracil-DNA glycosylase
MSVLPDILAPELDVVFCGTAVGSASASRGHYYAGRGNTFWEFLQTAGFTPTQLSPDDDASLPQFGVGLTDLVKDVAQSHDRGLDFSRTPDLERRLSTVRPRWVAFTGLRAGGEAATVFGHDKPRHGRQTWRIGDAQVFVVTNPSGAANDSRTWDGMSTKVGWWLELKRHIDGGHEHP